MGTKKTAEERQGYIYLLRNLVNGKGYVGQYGGRVVEHRWARHIASAAKGSQYAVHCAIRKYGTEKISAEVIWRGSVNQLNAKEVYYIKKLGTLSPDGYNLTTGGQRGDLCAKSLEKLSASLKQHYAEHPDELAALVDRITVALTDPAVRVRMSEAAKALWQPGTAYRKKAEASAKRRWLDPVKRAEAIAKMHSPEALTKCSSNMRKRWLDPTYAEMVVNSLKNAWKDPAYRAAHENPPPEVSAKLSAAANSRWAKPGARAHHGAAIRRAWSLKRAERLALNES